MGVQSDSHMPLSPLVYLPFSSKVPSFSTMSAVSTAQASLFIFRPLAPLTISLNTTSSSAFPI